MSLSVAGTATVIQADARQLPLDDGTVDLIVTSPPYFALRDYKDGDASLDGQIGAEATPQEFLEALWACSAEWWRVLAPSGSLWVNLGDKYDSKSLMGLPWRYAIGMTDGQGDPDAAGWILRAEVIWAKPNGLPESVRDRVSRKHEQWFHFTKSEHYFSAVDLIREQYQTSRDNPGGGNTYRAMRKAGAKDTNLGGAGYHALGKLPSSVWTVATEPLKVPDTFTDHFAAFPSEFPRRIILGWAPTRGVCQTCGEGLRPLTKKSASGTPRTGVGYSQEDWAAINRKEWAPGVTRTITGWACACDTTGSTRPAVVLDPFGGTGTTAAVAKALGCHGISVDLSAAYCDLARWRTNGDGYTKIAKKVADRTPSATQPTLEEEA